MASGKKQGYLEADRILLTLVLILAVFGVTMLFSTSEYNGRVRFGDSAYYFKKQLFAMSLGFLAMYLVAGMDYHFFIRLAPAAYAALLRSVSSSAGGGARDQWFQAVAESGTIVFSAFRICKSGSDPFFGLADPANQKQHFWFVVYGTDPCITSSGDRTCGLQ